MAEYTQEQINEDRKHYLKEQTQNAKDLLKITQGTEICYEVSCEYDLDKWDDNIISILETEEECIEMINDMKKEDEDIYIIEFDTIHK